MISVPCPNDCGSIRWANCEKYAAVVADRLCRKCFLATARTERAPAEPVKWYVDEMAVEALLAGRPVRTTPAERRAAVDYLTQHHEPAWVIAERLRVTPRTVTRMRKRIRESV